MWHNAHARARRHGVPFEIEPSDIIIPDACPVFGFHFEQALGSKGGGPRSPSLDRIWPALGYVPGNIIVVSGRANSIKTNATPDELDAVARYYGFLRVVQALKEHK